MATTFLNRFVWSCLLVTTALVLGGCGQDRTDLARTPIAMEKLQYPESATVDNVDDYHGTLVADPYRWLEDVDSAETAAWVTAQNEVTFAFLEGIPAREQYRQRLTELWDYVRYSTPFREGGRTFYFKNDGLQPQSVLYVQDSETSEPRVLLDPNLLSDDGTVALAGLSVSRDGKHLACATSVSGSDWHTWRIRDIDTGADLDDLVEWGKFSGAAWDHDGNGFYYSRYDTPAAGEALEGTNYFHKLYYHRRGTSQSEDVLVYERPDQKECGFGTEVSPDGRYLIITVWQGTSRNNRVYYQDLHDRSLRVHELLDDFDASYEYLGNNGPMFFFETNLDAPRGRIIAIDIRQPERDHWQTLIPQAADPIESATILNNNFLVTYMRDVVNVVKIFTLEGDHVTDLALPGLGSVGGFSGHPDDTETYYLFTSYLNPSEIYHYDLTKHESKLFRSPSIDFDFDAYETKQVFYHSRDGARVPMFLVYRKDLELDGSNPTVLYGYGGFNISLTPRFSTGLLPWLEAGGIWATANIRGGGEYGEQWHKAGMLANKQNSFDDFIAAAEYLIDESYTSPNKLAVYGGSNGGLLVGAVVNQRPELFGAAMPAVGVMDMLRFQNFTIGWAWTSDYGSSEDPQMFPVLYAYSPYHNLRPDVEYPAVMATTADHDDRVVPGHSFKYIARLQACQTGNLPTMIRIQTKAGHGAGKPTQMIIDEFADRYAFLHAVLQM